MNRAWLLAALLLGSGCLRTERLALGVGDAASGVLVLSTAAGSYSVRSFSLGDGEPWSTALEAISSEEAPLVLAFREPLAALGLPSGALEPAQAGEFALDLGRRSSAQYKLEGGGWRAARPEELPSLNVKPIPFPDPAHDLCAFESLAVLLRGDGDFRIDRQVSLGDVLYVWISSANDPAVPIEVRKIEVLETLPDPRILLNDGHTKLSSATAAWPRLQGGLFIELRRPPPGVYAIDPDRGTESPSALTDQVDVELLVDRGAEQLIFGRDHQPTMISGGQRRPLAAPSAYEYVSARPLGDSEPLILAERRADLGIWRWSGDALIEEASISGASRFRTMGRDAEGRLLVSSGSRLQSRDLEGRWTDVKSLEMPDAEVIQIAALDDRTMLLSTPPGVLTPQLEVLDVGQGRRARCANLTPEGNTMARLAGRSFGTVFNRNGQIYLRVYWAR